MQSLIQAWFKSAWNTSFSPQIARQSCRSNTMKMSGARATVPDGVADVTIQSIMRGLAVVPNAAYFEVNAKDGTLYNLI